MYDFATNQEKIDKAISQIKLRFYSGIVTDELREILEILESPIVAQLEIISETIAYKIGKSNGSFYILNKDGSYYTKQKYASYQDAASMLENLVDQDCGDYGDFYD